MKKSFRISLVALLAAVPMMAMAADPVYPATAEPTSDSNAPVASGNPKYALAPANSLTDGNAASAGYVKGAYNAAIKAINKVHDEAITAQSAANSANSAIAGLGSVYEAKGAATSAIAGLDSTVSQASAADKPAVTVKEVDGKLTEVTASIASGTISKNALNSTVQASLDKADSALQAHQTITTGSANGTISVAGSDVSVKGLGTAAYSAATAFDASGAATSAKTAIENKLSSGATGYDINAKSLKVNGTAVLTSHQDISGKINTSAISSALSSTSTNDQVAGAKATYDAIATAKSGAISTAAADATSKANAAESAAKSYADTELAKKINSTAISTAITSTSTDTQVASAKAVYDATKNAPTKTGVAATVNAAKGSKSGVSLGVNFGTITTNTSALKVSVPTKASYNIMQTWGSDSATAATYSLGSNSDASVTGTATTSIGATTATGSITDIAISVASYVAE